MNSVTIEIEITFPNKESSAQRIERILYYHRNVEDYVEQIPFEQLSGTIEILQNQRLIETNLEKRILLRDSISLIKQRYAQILAYFLVYLHRKKKIICTKKTWQDFFQLIFFLIMISYMYYQKYEMIFANPLRQCQENCKCINSQSIDMYPQKKLQECVKLPIVQQNIIQFIGQISLIVILRLLNFFFIISKFFLNKLHQAKNTVKKAFAKKDSLKLSPTLGQQKGSNKKKIREIINFEQKEPQRKQENRKAPMFVRNKGFKKRKNQLNQNEREKQEQSSIQLVDFSAKSKF